MKTWMLTITGRKKYWGNEQYGNDPVRRYSYDSLVQNHKALSVNDIVLIREGDQITGLSTIDEIRQKAGRKELNECPACRSSHVRFRPTIKPQWKCREGHEFETPTKSVRSVIAYEADFESSYAELSPSVDWRRLQSSFTNKSALSIRGVHSDAILVADDPELELLKSKLRTLVDLEAVDLERRWDTTSAVDRAKTALADLEGFLEGCRASDDTDPRQGNKLSLPIDSGQLSELWAEIQEISNQLDGPEAAFQDPKEPSYVMQQTRSFLSEFIKGAGKTAGALAAAGIAAKLLGLLDAVIVALELLAR